MNTQFLATVLKGWLAGCFAATAVLFAVGLTKQTLHPDGLTLATLAIGFLVAFVHLVFIIGLSAIPAAAVVWITKELRVHSAVVFAVSGAVIGWLGTRIIPPWPDTAVWPFVLAGLVAGSAYWFVAVRRKLAN